jgi:hypothetical protein
VLLIHGRNDQHVPVAQGRELAAAARRYLELAGEDHLGLPLRLDRLGGTVTAWFDHTQATGTKTCPMPEPPRAAAAHCRQAAARATSIQHSGPTATPPGGPVPASDAADAPTHAPDACRSAGQQPRFHQRGLDQRLMRGFQLGHRQAQRAAAQAGRAAAAHAGMGLASTNKRLCSGSRRIWMAIAAAASPDSAAMHSSCIRRGQGWR